MNEILEYREASANFLRIRLYTLPATAMHGKFFQTKDGRKEWHPDTDHNQMAMIIKHLQLEGYDIEIEWHQDGVDATIDKSGLEFVGKIWQCCDEDVDLIAFMKAFMSYVESIKQEG